MAEREKIGIVTDSGSMISPEEGERIGVPVVSYLIIFGEEQFRDQVDITATGVKQKFELTGRYPKTSAPAPGDFMAAYERQLDSGKILSIHIAKGIRPGTFNSATTAAQIIQEKLELQKNTIQVFDSKQVALALRFLVLEAVDFISRGENLETTVTKLQDMQTRLRTIGTFQDLRWAEKTAGIPREIISAFQRAKDFFQVSPIIQIVNGDWAKWRTRLARRTKAMQVMAEMALAGGKIEKMGIFQFDAQELAEEIAFHINKVENKKPEIFEAPASLAAGAGPGFVGISILEK